MKRRGFLRRVLTSLLAWPVARPLAPEPPIEVITRAIGPDAAAPFKALSPDLQRHWARQYSRTSIRVLLQPPVR